MRSAPPIAPGMPRRNARPAMPASCAALRDAHVRHRRAGADAMALGLDVVEAAAEPDHHARHAAVAHDQVGAEADHRDRNVARQVREEIGEIALVLRHEQAPAPARRRGTRSAARAAGWRAGGRAASAASTSGRERCRGSHGARQATFPAPQFARQRIGPLRDGAGAEADDDSRRASRCPCTMPASSLRAVERDHVAVAARAQRLHQIIAVGAFDRRFAGRIDIGDDHRVGVVEAGAERLEQEASRV